MNQRKAEKLARWRKALEDYVKAEYNNGLHLRLMVGKRMVDVWPTSGKYRINEGSTMVAHNPAQVLRAAMQHEDVSPNHDVLDTGVQEPALEPGTMANVVQFKRFEHGMEGTVWEQANTWLAEHAGSVQYMEAKLVPVTKYTDGPNYEEVMVLVYKILTEI